MSDYRRLVKNPAFRRLWSAQFISSMGDWLIVGILIPVVLQLSGGSSMAVAGIMIAKIVPSLLFSAVARIVAQRFNSRVVMLCSDLIRLVLVVVLLLSNSLPLIYLVLFLMESASQFYWPARNALISDIAEAEDRIAAENAMVVGQRVAMVVGLATAATVVRVFEQVVLWMIQHDMTNILQVLFDVTPLFVQSGIGYAVNLWAFVASALLLLTLRGRGTTDGSDDRETSSFHTTRKILGRAIGKDVRESLRFLRTRFELRTLLIALSVAIVGGGAVLPIGLTYIASLKGSIPLLDSIAWVSALTASRQIFLLTLVGIGLGIGAALVPCLEKYLGFRVTFPLFMAIFAAGMVGFAFNEQYFVAGTYAVAAGICVAIVMLTGFNYIVQSVCEEHRALILAAAESVMRISMIASLVIMTPISDLISGHVRRGLSAVGVEELLYLPLTGPRTAIIISAIIVGLAALYSFKTLYWNRRNCSEAKSAEEDPQK